MEALLTKAVLLITFAFQAFILYLLVRRRLQQRFFWFLLYITYEIVESALRFIVSDNSVLYVRVYWWTEIGDVSLTVLAFGESFLNVFRTYTRLRWFVVVIWSCIGAALLYAFFKALVAPPLQTTSRAAIIIGLEVAINFALSVVAILYFSLTALLRIREHRWDSGIISGFTVYIALSICGFLVRSIFGHRFGLLNAWLAPVGYLLAEATWAFELGWNELPVSASTRELTVDDLAKLEQYSKTLERVLGRKA